MNAFVLGLTIAAVTVVVLLLLWIVLRPAKKRAAPPVKGAQAPVPLPQNQSQRSKTKAVAPAAEGPSVDVPENASSTRWVGKMIDEHPDEAAAVLRRWIQEK